MLGCLCVCVCVCVYTQWSLVCLANAINIKDQFCACLRVFKTPPSIMGSVLACPRNGCASNIICSYLQHRKTGRGQGQSPHSQWNTHCVSVCALGKQTCSFVCETIFLFVSSNIFAYTVHDLQYCVGSGGLHDQDYMYNYSIWVWWQHTL